MPALSRLPVAAVCREPEILTAPVVDAPAPWAIRGRGYVSLMRGPAAVLDGDPFIAPALRGKRRPGRLAILMLVDYADTPAGPYRELLYIPGSYDFHGRQFWSISRIFVSTLDSVVNGRRNWGIPKDKAEFVFAPTPRGERITVSVDGREIAGFDYDRAGITLPLTTAIIPGSLRRLGQVMGDHLFTLAPGAGGRAGLSRLRDWHGDGKVMPDLSALKPILSVAIPRFHMSFPVASITPL